MALGERMTPALAKLAVPEVALVDQGVMTTTRPAGNE